MTDRIEGEKRLMKTTDVIQALRQAANVIEAEQEVIDGTHEYAHKYGGSPGNNVFRFLLEDATRLRVSPPEAAALSEERAFTGTVIIGPCQHLQTIPFHNTTNGEKGSYCLQCGDKLSAPPSGKQAAAPEAGEQ